MKKSISFLFFGTPHRPVGGFKVAFEYANHLTSCGYDVHLVYSMTLNPGQTSLKDLMRYARRKVFRISARSWFNLAPSISEHTVLTLRQRDVPRTDFYVATAMQTSRFLKDFDVPDDHKLYLIQAFENWGVSDQEVFDTYRYGLKNIAISKWLKAKVEQTGANCTLIRNGFDFDYFRLTNPIDTRSPFTISMLFHNDSRKGCGYGIEALTMVKAKYPQLKALFFGFPERPADLPEWIEYNHCPDRETHNRIYNTSSIYLAPSLQEGWGLTVGEAMICGNAIVCTDTLGFQEMVTEGKEGFIVPTRNSLALADAIMELIENPGLRIRMARTSVETISRFSWDESFNKLECLLNSQ